MSKKDSANIAELELLRKEIKSNFQVIKDREQLPKSGMIGGSLVSRTGLDPILTFHFLEFIFEEEYKDIHKEAGVIFIDDKTQWEYYLSSPNGYLRVYDWKGYAVSIGSVNDNQSTAEKTQEDADLLLQLLQRGLPKFLEYKKVSIKERLNNYPLDNFLEALFALIILFQQSREHNKEEGGYLESLILLVSIIDTQLRYLILLTRISVRKSNGVDPDFPPLFQQNDEEYFTERDIFKLAKDEVEFINYNKSLFFKQVGKLYDVRNRAVHRYAISNFQYAESLAIVEEMEHLPHVLGEIISKIEHEHAKLEIGFVKEDELDWQSEDEMIQMIRSVMESKINPSFMSKEAPVRDSMFSDKYEDGIHPKYKEAIEKAMQGANKKSNPKRKSK